MRPLWLFIWIDTMTTMDSTLQGHLVSPFNSPPSKPPFEESVTMLGEQPESNDSVATVCPVILSSEMKKKKKKKKISFSFGGLVLDHHHNTLDQLDQVDTLLPASPQEVAMATPQEPIVGSQMPMYKVLRLA